MNTHFRFRLGFAFSGKWARFGTWTKLEADAAPIVRSNPTYWSWLTILFWIDLAKLRGERY